jgi:hypothetical protein
MRKKITFYRLLIVGFIIAVVWFYYGSVPGFKGSLSASDVFEIRRVIQQETSEPVLRIQGQGAGSAMVQTGRVGNGLNGGGHFYYLNKTASGWQIVSRESWLSAWPPQSIKQPGASRLAQRQIQPRWRLNPAADADHSLHI